MQTMNEAVSEGLFVTFMPVIAVDTPSFPTAYAATVQINQVIFLGTSKVPKEAKITV